ncbi:MAG: M15 family metallopeptidase [Alphaproteobacteria bacterium]|nr:M15 family metallopeptidase [Alphaproteobacteria bacterium]
MSEMFEGHKPSELGVELDLRYATANNICGRPLYSNGEKVWLHEKAMSLLVKAASLAVEEGYKLLVFDAYRPQRVQEALWAQCPDDDYVADPKKGSLHTRGIAVDVTLMKWEIEYEPHIRETPSDVIDEVVEGPWWQAVPLPVDMGTDFDEMSEKAHWNAFEKGLITPEQRENRLALRAIMESAGFETIPAEWWHYQIPLEGKERLYPLIEEHEEASLTDPALLAEAA